MPCQPITEDPFYVYMLKQLKYQPTTASISIYMPWSFHVFREVPGFSPPENLQL